MDSDSELVFVEGKGTCLPMNVQAQAIREHDGTRFTLIKDSAGSWSVVRDLHPVRPGQRTWTFLTETRARAAFSALVDPGGAPPPAVG